MRTTYAEGKHDDLELKIPSTEFSGKDLILRYQVTNSRRNGPTIWNSAYNGTDRVHEAIRQDLIFTFGERQWTREVFTREYADEKYPDFHHPDNRYLIRLTSGFIGENVVAVEDARIKAKADRIKDPTEARTRRLSYGYQYKAIRHPLRA